MFNRLLPKVKNRGDRDRCSLIKGGGAMMRVGRRAPIS